MNQTERAARNHNIKKMALEGKTVDEIADFYSMKRTRVQSILRFYGVKACKESHRLKSGMAKKIEEELQAGTKQIEIAKKLNVSRQYVNQVKMFFEEQD